MASLSHITASSISASEVAQLISDSAFSTTVGGKTYTADVVASQGIYIASDPSLVGAIATGSSMLAAENNEIARIDFFA